MMIETKGPMELLTIKLHEVEINLGNLEKIESKGIISPRFRGYCEHLLCLYQCYEEIETFDNLNWLDKFFSSHRDARLQLDAISELYFEDGFRNEDLRNAYNELYLFAKNEYSKLNNQNLKN